MSAPLRDPKALTEFLELDYFQRPRRLGRLQRLLNWGVLFACAGLVAFTVLQPSRHTFYQAGPVSEAHALFRHDCQTCHTEAFQTARRLWPGNAHLHSVADQTCLQCHDGPRHNPLVATAGCAGCHQEHRGPGRLARVADGQCTVCHADLQERFAGLTDLGNVQAFAADKHPPFRWWQERPDPGTVAFNHAKHLNPDGVLVLDPKQAELQGLPDGAGPQQIRHKLQCSACHQPDVAGRYMLPINYERHCQGCHPLSVRVAGDWKEDKLRQAAARFAREPAPHRESVVVRAALRERYAQLARQHAAELFDTSAPGAEEELRRVIPGRPGPALPSKEEWIWVGEQMRTAEHVLFGGPGGCRSCHTGPLRWNMPDNLPEYAPSQINKRWFSEKLGESSRWLPQSTFNHHRHRMMQCLDCHPAAGSRHTRDVLMPTLPQCTACHNPTAGARSACIECHPYHPHAGRQDWKLRAPQK